MSARPSEAALWRSVAVTLREVALGSLAGDDAHLAVVRLVGLATYAGGRGDDPGPARTAALAAVLDALSANAIVVTAWPRAGRGESEVAQACSDILVACVGRDDAAAGEVRARLRPLLVEHLDADRAEHAVLLDTFRGRLPRGADG